MLSIALSGLIPFYYVLIIKGIYAGIQAVEGRFWRESLTFTQTLLETSESCF
jgi:hypothetical protein